MRRAAIALIARAPSAGGKSRLAPHVAAARLHALRVALIADAIELVGSTGEHFDPYVFFTPEDGRAEIQTLVRGKATLVAQQGRDLGERMSRAVERLLVDDRHRCAVLVGSDVPLLTARDLVDAGQGLRSADDVVIGPAEDGGYYMIGMRTPHLTLFNGVSWGSATVLSQTLAQATALGIDPQLMRRAYDIDTIEDLRRAERDLDASGPDTARHLRAWFEDA